MPFLNVSIHTPLREWFLWYNHCMEYDVSIHTPLREWFRITLLRSSRISFNPHSLTGVIPKRSESGKALSFNPHSLTGVIQKKIWWWHDGSFNPHSLTGVIQWIWCTKMEYSFNPHSLTGVILNSYWPLKKQAKFQSTLPYGSDS